MRHLLIVVLLAGCATGPQLVWRNDSKPGSAFYADNGECLQQAFAAIPDASPATQPAPAVVIGGAPRGTSRAFMDGWNSTEAALEADRKQAARNQIHRGCLAGRGWRIEQQ